MEFGVKTEEKYAQIDCPTYRYNLTIRKPVQKTPWRQVMFKQMVGLAEDPVYITGRLIEEYDSDVRNLPLNPKMQYVEIGAGLGGFTPHLVGRLNGSMKKKPVVIDPADYSLMRDMLRKGLEVVKEQDYPAETVRTVESFLERAGFYEESESIRLLNMPLSQAVFEFPDLVQSADFLIDHRGSRLYPQTENLTRKISMKDMRNIREVRRLVLKRGGVFAGDY